MRIAMVAGEASGDLLGGHLVNALTSLDNQASFVGIGGARMRAAGFESWYPMEKLSVRGYVEVLRHYREIMGIRRALCDRLLDERPDVFVGIDAPDFNLGLEARLKSAGIPTVHYVSPSVWAWRRGRIRKIAKSASHLLVLFPFEADLYRDAGLPVTYVGHPVADAVPLQVGKAAAKEQLRLSPNKVIIALLPGSRESELRYMADTFVLTAQRIAEKIPNVQFLCPLGTRLTRDLFEAAIHRHQAQELPITMMFGHSHAALAAADLALVASGTATLETALFKTPMVITYKMAGLTWQMMRRMLYLPYVGLPNILAGEFIVDEFMQDAATPEALSQAMLQLFGDTTRQKQQIARFTEMHETLRQDNAARAADAVMQLARSHQPVGVR